MRQLMRVEAEVALDGPLQTQHYLVAYTAGKQPFKEHLILLHILQQHTTKQLMAHLR